MMKVHFLNFADSELTFVSMIANKCFSALRSLFQNSTAFNVDKTVQKSFLLIQNQKFCIQALPPTKLCISTDRFANVYSCGSKIGEV